MIAGPTLIDQHAPPRQFALDVVNRLRQAGYEALWAGGCVRDELLGKTPKDYDVATDAEPEQIRELFGRRRTIPIGAAFGVITVQGPPQAGLIEVATFRRDADYSDGRRPDSVTFTSAEEDARRRDFTINGLFYDPIERRVIDYVGGEDDLREGILRAIGDPLRRISEDKLRLLRAVRFTTSLGFEMEGATLNAVCRLAPSISVVSAERIAAEMRRMLIHPNRSQAVSLLHTTGLLAIIMPEAGALHACEQTDLWTKSLSRLGRLTDPTFALSLATMLHPAATRQTIEAIGERWKLSNDEIAQGSWLAEHDTALDHATGLPWSGLQPLLIHRASVELVCLLAVRADNGECDGAMVDYCRQKMALPAEQLDPVPLITGDDLQQHGIRPGPVYRRLLQAARDGQLDGQISTAEQALVLVDRLLAIGTSRVPKKRKNHGGHGGKKGRSIGENGDSSN